MSCSECRGEGTGLNQPRQCVQIHSRCILCILVVMEYTLICLLLVTTWSSLLLKTGIIPLFEPQDCYHARRFLANRDFDRPHSWSVAKWQLQFYTKIKCLILPSFLAGFMHSCSLSVSWAICRCSILMRKVHACFRSLFSPMCCLILMM